MPINNLRIAPLFLLPETCSIRWIIRLSIFRVYPEELAEQQAVLKSLYRLFFFPVSNILQKFPTVWPHREILSLSICALCRSDGMMSNLSTVILENMSCLPEKQGT